MSGASEPPPAALLMLARFCAWLEAEAVANALEALAAAFPGQGGGTSRPDQPPAFVAGEVARCAWLCRTSIVLLRAATEAGSLDKNLGI